MAADAEKKEEEVRKRAWARYGGVAEAVRSAVVAKGGRLEGLLRTSACCVRPPCRLQPSFLQRGPMTSGARQQRGKKLAVLSEADPCGGMRRRIVVSGGF